VVDHVLRHDALLVWEDPGNVRLGGVTVRLGQQIPATGEGSAEQLLTGPLECGVPVEGDYVLDQPGVDEPGESVVGGGGLPVRVEAGEGRAGRRS